MFKNDYAGFLVCIGCLCTNNLDVVVGVTVPGQKACLACVCCALSSVPSIINNINTSISDSKS